MKFKFLSAAAYAILAASAANWDALVASAVEAGIADAASLTPEELMQRLTEPSAESHSDQSAQLQQITAQLADRDQVIETQKSKIENLTAEVARLNAKPGDTPATLKADGDPPPATQDMAEHAVLTGKESLSERMSKVAEWAGLS